MQAVSFYVTMISIEIAMNSIRHEAIIEVFAAKLNLLYVPSEQGYNPASDAYAWSLRQHISSLLIISIASFR